jgi:hypothetical protein
MNNKNQNISKQIKLFVSLILCLMPLVCHGQIQVAAVSATSSVASGYASVNSLIDGLRPGGQWETHSYSAWNTDANGFYLLLNFGKVQDLKSVTLYYNGIYSPKKVVLAFSNFATPAYNDANSWTGLVVKDSGWGGISNSELSSTIDLTGYNGRWARIHVIPTVDNGSNAWTMFDEISFEAYSGQMAIDRVNLMPNIPYPFLMRDWKKVARDLDALLFDENITGTYLPQFKWDYDHYNAEFDTFGLDSYIGVFRDYPGTGPGELWVNAGALISAGLVGIDKTNQNGHNFAIMAEEHFNLIKGLYKFNDNVCDASNSYGYDVAADVLGWMIYRLYPDQGNFHNEVIASLDRYTKMVYLLGPKDGNLPAFDSDGFDFTKWEPYVDGICNRDAPGGIAWMAYQAYLDTNQPQYLTTADWCLKSLNDRDITYNPLGDILLYFGPITAAKMNAELDRNYNVKKLLDWCFTPNLENASRPGWGVTAGNWGGYDMSGLVGDAGGYGFSMHTFQFIGTAVPVVRYDERFARTIGKWVLNAANSLRYMYPNGLPAQNQSSPGKVWAEQFDTNYSICNEGIRKYAVSHHSQISDYQTTLGTITDGNSGATYFCGDNDYEEFSEVKQGSYYNLLHTWKVSLPTTSTNVGYSIQILGYAEHSNSNDGFIFEWSTSTSGTWNTIGTLAGTTYIIGSGGPSSNGGVVYVRARGTGTAANAQKLYVDGIVFYGTDTGVCPFSSGDSYSGTPGARTDLCLYGACHVGLLGAVVSQTNDDKVLQLDLCATDFFPGKKYPSYLYYNPHNAAVSIQINVGTSPQDIYDTISNAFIAMNVTGQTSFNIAADSAKVLVCVPASGAISFESNHMLVDGTVVDYYPEMNPTTCEQVQLSPYKLSGDVDGDCHVNMADLALLAQQWLTSGSSPENADTDHSGIIDFKDFAKLVGDWLKCNDPQNYTCLINW